VEPAEDWRSDCLGEQELLVGELCGFLGRLHSLEGLAQSNNNAKLNYSAKHEQKLLEMSRSCSRLKELMGQGKNFCLGFVDYRNKKIQELTDKPGKLIPLDRGGVPDLSVSGDNFDLVVVDPHDPTTTSETRSANAITKINSCTQSKNEQEFEANNLNITRRWSLNYTTAARWRLFGCS
jgi:hypothetical protein